MQHNIDAIFNKIVFMQVALNVIVSLLSRQQRHYKHVEL